MVLKSREKLSQKRIYHMPKTNIEVKLVNENGNAFLILGKVRNALKKAGHANLAEEYMKEARSGDYDHLLATTMEYVEVV